MGKDEEGASLLQKDFDRLFQWSLTWQKSFNAESEKPYFGPTNIVMILT